MQNRAGKRQKHICRCRAVKGLAAAIQRGMAAALVFMFCFFMAFTVPAEAASGGAEHHTDTLDYCLRVHDVSVNMTELQGLNEGQKKELVENASGYAFYTWKTLWTEWGERVSGSGDFSSVNWDQEGTYKITVKMTPLHEGVRSEIFYYLTVVDDLPKPEPPAPAICRVTVRYLDEETGEPLKDDFVSDEMEEGSPFEIGADILLPPEGYTVAEIQGDLTGEMTSDREILVICRKQETGPQEPLEPEEPEDPEDPEAGNTEAPEGPEEQGGENNENPEGPAGMTNGENSNASSNSNSNHNKGPGKNSGKTSGSGRTGSSGTTGSGRTGSSIASSGSRASAGQTRKVPSAAAQAAAQTDSQSEAPAAEAQTAETVPEPEESTMPAREEEMPEAVLTEDAAAETSAALAGGEGGGDQSALGGAVIAQTKAQKEQYPLWSMAVGAAEAGVLTVLGYMIFSDLRLILWFEKKKRR